MSQNQLSPDSALDSLANDAESENDDGSFMKPALKKRGRPKGSKSAKSSNKDESSASSVEFSPKNDRKEQIETLKQLTEPLCSTISQLGVKIAEDQRAAMSKDQLENCSTALAKCIDRYAPNALNEHAELIACLVMFGMYGTQVYLIRQENLEKLQREKALATVTPVVPSN